MDVTTYRRLRRKGLKPRDIARWTPVESLDWNAWTGRDEDITAHVMTIDGFEVRITQIYDTDTKPDYIGSFESVSNSIGFEMPWRLIDREEQLVKGLHLREGARRGEQNAIRVTYPYVEAYKDARTLLKMGKAAADDYAREQVRWQIDQLETWASDQWYYVGIVAKARYHGALLGTDSLFGIESTDQEYLDRTAREIAENAVEEAKKALAAIIAKTGSADCQHCPFHCNGHAA